MSARRTRSAGLPRICLRGSVTLLLIRAVPVNNDSPCVPPVNSFPGLRVAVQHRAKATFDSLGRSPAKVVHAEPRRLAPPPLLTAFGQTPELSLNFVVGSDGRALDPANPDGRIDMTA
jgi:hypothetical protein